MSHLDSSALATYNSLVDPNLKCYFSNERIQSHLRHAGLISRRGEIISESEYRKRLVRRDHRRHVRQMLAENIVHRAIDMERARQAEIRRQLDLVAKVTLVNNMKETQRRRRAHSSVQPEASREEMAPLSMHSSWSHSRSKSPSEPIQPLRFADDERDEQPARIPRVHSAYVQSKAKKTFTKTSEANSRRSRTLSRPKSSLMNVVRPAKITGTDLLSPQPPCEITMVYYGPNMKIDYDQTLFEPVDEVLVMQQHSGGENLIVYKGQLRAGEQFSFKSRRHANFPLGLSFYVKGLFDSRISTCCEYKHRHGVRLGGERGHFAVLSVQGSKPCLKCRFEKQLKTKDAPESTEEKSKSISIAIPPSEQEQRRITPMKIPVRHSTTPNENYSEDFDADSKGKRSAEKRSSIDSTLPKSQTTDEKLLSRRSSSTTPRPKSPDETNSTSTIVSTDKTPLKTWQITFHTTNTPTGSLQIPSRFLSKSFLNFAFLSKNREKRTETYSIALDDASQCFQSGRQDSFPAKLTQIGQPEEIELTLLVDDDDENDKAKIKWHLDFIELIDPETQHHWKFPCQKWIRPFEEHFLRLASPSARSSVSSTGEKVRLPSRTSSTSSSSKQKKTSHRLSIFSANEEDGEFSPSDQTKLFIKINEREIPLSNGDSSFRPGQMKSFDVTLPKQRIEEFHFGFVNSHITARCWKIEKIVLLSKETNEELTFVPRRPLIRNDFDFRAETLFLLQSDDDQRNVRMTSASLSSDSETNVRPTTNSRPKTRRGREENALLAGRDEEETPKDEEEEEEEVWRASSSTDRRASSRTTKSTEENLFENWYPKKSNDE